MAQAGLQVAVAVANHQAAGKTGVPPELLDHQYVAPVAGGAYPADSPDSPEDDRIAPLPGTPETALSRRQEMLLSLMLNGSSLTAAARVVGVTRGTAAAWTRQEGFAAEFRRLRAESLSGSLQHLTSLLAGATRAVEEALAPGQPIETRLRAAGLVFTTVGLRWANLVDLPDVLPSADEGAQQAQHAQPGADPTAAENVVPLRSPRSA